MAALCEKGGGDKGWLVMGCGQHGEAMEGVGKDSQDCWCPQSTDIWSVTQRQRKF